MTRNPIYSRNFGLLLGSRTKTKNRYIIHINHIMPLGRIKPHKDPKALSDRKWNAIQNKVYNLYPSQEIVGWYGVRNGWEAMLTEQDQRIHREFFTKSWQVVYLLDAFNKSSSFFYWDKDKLKLSSGYYKYQDKTLQQTRSDARKLKWPLVALSFATLAVLSYVFLDKGYLKDYLTRSQDKNISGYADQIDAGSMVSTESEGDVQKKPNDLSQNKASHGGASADRSNQDESNKEAQEYMDRIAQLEKQLAEKDEGIRELKEEMQSMLPNHSEGDVSQEGTVYIIQSGDNLYKISQKFYNTDKYAGTLAKVNRIKNQRSLTIGSYLVIPSIEEIENAR